ncbi:zinc ribbon domain-containing protein [Halobacteriaceae archaeon GCM10025711]
MARFPGQLWDGEASDEGRPERVHCRDCGRELRRTAARCEVCWNRQRTVEADRSPGVAALLSLVVPGAGHAYNGHARAGLLRLPLLVFGIASVVVVSFEDGVTFEGFKPAWYVATQVLPFFAFVAYEAARQAARVNEGLDGGEDVEQCPECATRNPVTATYCRGCGVELPAADAEESETETTYRFLTRVGVCFCERCRTQVSPNDRACPSCGYALRVETTVAPDATAGPG